jgi:hypothetical protein
MGYIEELKEEYINHYNQSKFSEDYYKLNNNITVREEEKKMREDYNWMVFNSISLNERYSYNEQYHAIFLTLTLSSQFHKYKKVGDTFVLNKKFAKGNTINLGYKVLNEAFKDIYKNFRVKRDFIKVNYFKVFEPHKNYTPHLHSLIYIPKEYLSQFLAFLERKIKSNKNLGKQYKIEVIRDIERASSYLIKYVNKGFSSENKDFLGWRKKEKIRAFSCSKTYLNREYFKKISHHFKPILSELESYFGTTNVYEVITHLTKIVELRINLATGEVSRKVVDAGERDIFVVVLSRYINIHQSSSLDFIKFSTKKKLKSELFELKKFNNFNYFLLQQSGKNWEQSTFKEVEELFNLYQKKESNKNQYRYKKDEFKIYKISPDNSYFELIFDQNDYR